MRTRIVTVWFRNWKSHTSPHIISNYHDIHEHYNAPLENDNNAIKATCGGRNATQEITHFKWNAHFYESNWRKLHIQANVQENCLKFGEFPDGHVYYFVIK